MSTTFRFTSAQITELEQLRDQARIDGNYFIVHQRILDILDPLGPGSNIDDDVIKQSYFWFAGARQVNEGAESGPFATLVIEYTQRQALLRLWTTVR